MTAEIVIQKLMCIGYRVQTDGDDIILKADLDPDPVLAIPLIAELKQCKTEAVSLLKRRIVEWPADVKNLIDQFLISPTPESPFQLNRHTTVIDAGKFYSALRRDIEAGPKGPRARTGAIQCDLRDLQDKLH